MPIHDQQQQPAEPAQQAIQPLTQPQQPEPQPEPVSDDRYELMGDVRMQDDTMSMSQIVEGLDSGNPLAIEQFNLGTDGAGNPVATFRTPGGIMQHIKLSSSQWLGIRDQRNDNRKKMATYQYNQDKLQKKVKELSGSFENALADVDDPLFLSVLESNFAEAPEQTTRELLEYRRALESDEKDAERIRMEVIERTLSASAGKISQQYDDSLSTYEKTFNEQYNVAVRTGSGDLGELQRRRQQNQRRLSVMRSGGNHRPIEGSMQMSPGEVWQGQTIQPVLKDWLNMLQEGVPNEDGTVQSFTIPHPSDPNFPSRFQELIPALDSLATSLGWQNGFSTETDIMSIMTAVDSHYNVHGEQVRIQQLERQVVEMEKERDKKYQAMRPRDEDYESKGVEMDSMRGDIERLKSLDLNNNGFVDSWEKQANPEAVETATGLRQGYRDARRATFGAGVTGSTDDRDAQAVTDNTDAGKSYDSVTKWQKRISEVEELIDEAENYGDESKIPEFKAEIVTLREQLEEAREIYNSSTSVSELENDLTIMQKAMSPEQHDRWKAIITDQDELNKYLSGTPFEGNAALFMTTIKDSDRKAETLKIVMNIIESLD